MRMLFTCRPGMGHFQPLVPLAQAAQQHGHVVAFATGEPIVGKAQAAGFHTYPAGLSEAESRARCVELGVVFRDLPPQEMRPFAFGRWFSGVEAPQRLYDLDRICREFRPDVLVHGVAELAAPLAATKAGKPWVTVGFGLLLPSSLATLAGQGVARLWQASGLTAPPWGGLYKHLYVDPFPKALQSPEIAELPAAIGIRPPGSAATATSRELGDRQRTYVTFGTVWNNGPAAVELMRRAVLGSAEACADIVVTVGSDNDPALLGPLPGNVQVQRFVPQDKLLPTCACIVSHAGSGTLLGALAWGLPSLLLPQFADQFDNADQARRAGVALVLQPADVSNEAIANGVRRLLDEPAFTKRAADVGAELSAMPDAVAILDRIETLAGS